MAGVSGTVVENRRPFREAYLATSHHGAGAAGHFRAGRTRAGPGLEQETVSSPRARSRDYWTADRMQVGQAGRAAVRGRRCRARRSRARRCRGPREEITTPYTQAPTLHARQGVLHARRQRLRLLGHRAAERQQERGLDRRATASTRARATSPPTGSSCPPTRTGRRRSASTSPRTCSRRRRGRTAATSATTSARPWSARRAGPRSPTVSAVVGSRSTTTARRTYMSYGYPAAPPFTGERLWRCNSPLQTQRQLGQPGDDGHRLRHDRRLQRRRLDRRRRTCTRSTPTATTTSRT